MTLVGKRKRDGSAVARFLAKRAKSKRTQVGRSVFSKPRNMRPRLGALSTYRYSRWASEAQTFDITTTSFQGSSTFTLDDVKGYTDFTNLYDQFMITHAQLHISLITNPNAAYPINGTGSSAVINPTNWFPKLWYVYDSDDDTSLSLDTIRERQGVKYKTLRPSSTIVINIKPKFASQTYRTQTSTGYAPKRGYLDVATAQNVPHYGLKFVVDTMGVNPNDSYPFQIRVETKYWLKFKGVL